MISVTFNAETPDALLSDLQRIFPHLLAGTPLPPMAEQPNRDPAPAEPAKRTRKTKEEKEAAGEPASGGSQTTSNPDAEGSQSNGSTASSTAASTEPPSPSGATAEVPDIELVRAKLKQLGATDGLGHDKVFEVLGRYKATNASSVPTEKRAELIAEIDALLAGVSK